MSIDLEHFNYMKKKKKKERIGCGYKFRYCLIHLEEMVFQFTSLTVHVNNEKHGIFLITFPPFFVNISPLFFLSLIFVIFISFLFFNICLI
jgi:hypothetical protein